MMDQKTLIKITDVKEIVGKNVTVIMENGNELKLPINQVERYGTRIFIPTWLAKIVDTHGLTPVGIY